jgi:hypothetical protein
MNENDTKKLPRGLRNNNPLNIRRSAAKWKGLRKEQTDAQFCQFESMAYGWRAAFKLLIDNYYHHHGRTTIRYIIYRWAPPNDGNDTKAYIARVIGLMGYKDADGLQPSDVTMPYPSRYGFMWRRLARAMGQVENGVEMDYQPLLDGWNMYWNERTHQP